MLMMNFLNKEPFLFKKKKTLQERVIESVNIRKKYPGRIPIICERQGINIPSIDRTKYLVPNDLTMGQFIYVIRKRLSLNSSLGLFLFVGEDGLLVNNAKLVSECYNQHKDDDGFLYIKYRGENTFG
jgi:GABA(A) receptor-associated protein